MLKKNSYLHTPILSDSIISNINFYKDTNQTISIVDMTSGEGGHSSIISNLINVNSKLICIDIDANIIKINKSRVNPNNIPQILHICDNYKNIDKILYKNSLNNLIDHFIFDLGISMYHYKSSNSGFSFKDDTLDMRLSSNMQYTAKHIVNNFSFNELSDLFYYLGEEYKNRSMVTNIINYRSKNEIKTAKELCEIINQSSKKSYKKINNSTKAFQAIRIFINKEFHNILYGISYAIKNLKVKGYIYIITFHSIEDRLVKIISKVFNKPCLCYKLKCNYNCESIVDIINKRVIKPNFKEIEENISARSAKLRIIQKNREVNEDEIKQIIQICYNELVKYPNFSYYFTNVKPSINNGMAEYQLH